MGEYEGLRVQIILSNNFSYSGLVINEDDSFIQIRDKFNLLVSIKKSDIQVIKEVSR